MRALSIVALVVCAAASAACAVRVPQPPGLAISVKARARVHAEVRGQAAVDAAPVPLQGAAVVEFFGIPLEGADEVVFVLDRSGSMEQLAEGRLAEVEVPPPPADGEPPPAGAPAAAPTAPRKIDVARRELIDALERLPTGTRANVIFFNGELDALAPAIEPLGDDLRAAMIDVVQMLEPDGSTALAPAMRLAFLMNARRIVLLSDGRGNVGGGSRGLLRDAREAMRGGVRIDTIGVGAGQDRALLQQLADESGGIYQAL